MVSKFKYLLLFLSISCFLFSCNSFLSSKNNVQENKFGDSLIRVIHELKYQNDIEELSYFLSDSSVYKIEVLKAMLSINDSTKPNLFYKLLTDTSVEVQSLVAKNLGLLESDESIAFLLESFNYYSETVIDNARIEALGMIGNNEHFNFIYSFNDTNYYQGKIRAFYNGVLTSKINFNKSVIATVNYTLKHGDEESIVFAFQLLSLIDASTLKKYQFPYIDSLLNSSSKQVLSEAIKTNVKINGVNEDLFKLITDSSTAQLIKNNIAKSGLTTAYFENHKKNYIDVLNTKNSLVTQIIAQNFIDSGLPSWYSAKDLLAVNDTLSKILLAKAFLIHHKEESFAVNWLVSSMYTVKNDYYIGNVLLGLAYNKDVFDIINYQLVSFNTITRSYAYEAMYNYTNNFLDENNQSSLYKVFKKGVLTGDAAAVYYSALALRKEEFKVYFDENAKDIAMLYDALDLLKLPNDYESYVEVLKTIRILKNQTFSSDADNIINHVYKADWSAIQYLTDDFKIVVKTTKGSFSIKPNFNEAPYSVIRFLENIKLGKYDSVAVHRVIPNFVIQTGCNRGDGFGSGDEVLRTEITTNPFTLNSVGFASAGKDTESLQYFAMTGNAYFLNNRYTNFGDVVNGQSVIQNLEIGDVVLSIDTEN